MSLSLVRSLLSQQVPSEHLLCAKQILLALQKRRGGALVCSQGAHSIGGGSANPFVGVPEVPPVSCPYLLTKQLTVLSMHRAGCSGPHFMWDSGLIATSSFLLFSFVFGFIFETGFLCVALAVPELTM